MNTTVPRLPVKGNCQTGVMLSKLWKTTPSGKKSQAQPRPVVAVPPGGIGPVLDFNENDVLCGRGAKINSHSGNIQFREIVNKTKKKYLSESTKKLEKAHIAAKVVQQIRTMDPPGRFLKENPPEGPWFDIGDAKAIKKVGQALREDAPDIRQKLKNEDGSTKSGDVSTTKQQTTSSERDEEITLSSKSKAKRSHPQKRDKKSRSSTKSSKSTLVHPSKRSTRSRSNNPCVVGKDCSSVGECQSSSSMVSIYQRSGPKDVGSFSALPNKAEENQDSMQANVDAVVSSQAVHEAAVPPCTTFAQKTCNMGIEVRLTQSHASSLKLEGMKNRMSRNKKTGGYSEKAMETMSQNHSIPLIGGGKSDSSRFHAPPQTIAFGRDFFPTASEANSGGSTISGLSNMSSILDGSILSAISVISSSTPGVNQCLLVQENGPLREQQNYSATENDVHLNAFAQPIPDSANSNGIKMIPIADIPLTNEMNSFDYVSEMNNVSMSPFTGQNSNDQDIIMREDFHTQKDSDIAPKGSSLDLGCFLRDDISLGSNSQRWAQEFGLMKQSSFSSRGSSLAKSNIFTGVHSHDGDLSILDAMSTGVQSHGGDLSFFGAMSLISHESADANSMSLDSHYNTCPSYPG